MIAKIPHTGDTNSLDSKTNTNLKRLRDFFVVDKLRNFLYLFIFFVLGFKPLGGGERGGGVKKRGRKKK